MPIRGRTFGIGRGLGAGAAALTAEQPWYYSHPGELHPDEYLAAHGIVRDPETGLWPEEAYKIAPGIAPTIYEEYYRAHSRPFEEIPGPRLSPLDLSAIERRVSERTNREARGAEYAAAEERNASLQNLINNPTAVTRSILERNRAPIDETYLSPWNKYLKKGVFEPLETSAREHLLEKVLPAIDAQLISTGNFRSPRRSSLYGTAVRDMERNLTAAKERALYEAAQMGAKSYEAEKGRNIEEASLSQADRRTAIDAARSVEHTIGEQQKREMLDEASLEALERTKTAQKQLALDMTYAENERRREYERDMAARKLAAVKSIPIPSATSAVYPSTSREVSPSLFSQLAGIGTSLYGMSMRGGGGGGAAAGRKAGGRVTKANGGSILDRYINRSDPLNDIKDQLMDSYIENGEMEQNINPIPEFLMKEQTNSIAPMPVANTNNISPIEVGASYATKSHARMKRDYHQAEMEKYANRLNDEEGVNPWGSFLARAGARFAASSAPFGQRLGEALESGIGGYEGAVEQNIKAQERAQQLRKTLDDTYRIEELDQHKRHMEEQDFNLAKEKHEEVKRHNKELEKYYKTGSNKGSKSEKETTLVAVPVSEEDNKVKTEVIKVVPMNKKREDRLQKLKEAWDANQEGLKIIESMSEDVGELGYTGVGGSTLHPVVATLGGLYGNTAKHTNLFKKANDLSTIKVLTYKNLKPNIFIEKQIRRGKPEESDTLESIKENITDHENLFNRNIIEIVAERKMLQSGVPDDIMDDALLAWRKANKYLGEDKGSPLDYLPQGWKVTIGAVQESKKATDIASNEVKEEVNDNRNYLSPERREKLSSIQEERKAIEEKLGIKR